MIDLDLKFEPPLQEIEKRLAGFSEILRSKALNAGLVGASAPLKMAMKSNAPRMAKYIGHRQLSVTARSRIGLDPKYQRAILVGATKSITRGGSIASKIEIGGQAAKVKRIRQSAGKKAIWTEFGTKPHIIRPRRRGGFLRFLGLFLPFVSHPGTRAQYWMARANASTGHCPGAAPSPPPAAA